MSSAERWPDPGRPARYRERVLGERAKLSAAFADAAGHQRRALADLLEFNAATDFGRGHDFARVRDLADFRKAVPIRDYEALSPWVERAAAGEPGVLTADPPALFFTSSGTTGRHKKIPVTRRFMQTSFFPFYYAAWAPLAEHCADALGRPGAAFNLKHDPLSSPPTTASGRPHVGASQVNFGDLFGEPLSAEPGAFAPWAALPARVDPGDHLERAYMRLRLAVEGDVRCVIGINPAMVAALPYQLRLWWPKIVKEVRDGTLGGEPHAPPNPARAAELEGLEARFGTVRPGHVWPNMRALFCWTTGLASLYLPRLREEFGAGVVALPAPVAASEGPVAVALDRHPRACSLVVTASVYEFVDADLDLGPNAETVGPEGLEPGRDYHVVFSHVGGLYRYAVGDVVRAVDLVDGVPRVEYAGRANRSNVAGERLRDAQAVRALGEALGGGGLEAHNAACRAEPSPGEAPRYHFAIAPRTPWAEGEAARFVGRLDASLSRESADYRAARGEGLLGPPALTLLDADAFQRDWHEAVKKGTRPTQVKDRLFWQDEGAFRRLTGRLEGHNERGLP